MCLLSYFTWLQCNNRYLILMLYIGFLDTTYHSVWSLIVIYNWNSYDLLFLFILKVSKHLNIIHSVYESNIFILSLKVHCHM